MRSALPPPLSAPGQMQKCCQLPGARRCSAEAACCVELRMAICLWRFGSLDHLFSGGVKRAQCHLPGVVMRHANNREYLPSIMPLP